jgi:hypothetical protein
MRILASMRHALALILGCLALSACGSGEDGEGERTDAIEPEAQEQAESLLLVASDLPTGWLAAERPSAEENEAVEEFNRCTGSDISQFAEGNAQSEGFERNEWAVVSDAQIFTSDEEAAEAVGSTEEVEFDRIEDCMVIFAGRLNVEVIDVHASELEIPITPGVDDTFAWQLKVTWEGLEDDGMSATSYFEYVQLRKSDAAAGLSVSGIGTPFDPALRDELLSTIAGRMGPE